MEPKPEEYGESILTDLYYQEWFWQNWLRYEKVRYEFPGEKAKRFQEQYQKDLLIKI